MDETLTEIFSCSGKKTVLFYLKNRFGVTPEDIVHRPRLLHQGLEGLLGDLGSSIVHDHIMRRAAKLERSMMAKGSQTAAVDLSHRLKNELNPSPSYTAVEWSKNLYQ